MTLSRPRVRELPAERSTSARCSSRSWAGTSTQPQLDVASRRPDVSPCTPSPRSAACRRSHVARLTGAFPTMPPAARSSSRSPSPPTSISIIYVDKPPRPPDLAMGATRAGQAAACREHRLPPQTSPASADPEAGRDHFHAWTKKRSSTLTDVTRRSCATRFDLDRVTKRFYDRFKSEHAAFLKFIKGITDQGDHEWYASLMLNRLMFVYFIQKKGFLDGDPDYLRNRLKQRPAARRARTSSTPSTATSCCACSTKGFGSSQAARLRAGQAARQGSLPQRRPVRRPRARRDATPSIEIPDEAFERLFDFFDAVPLAPRRHGRCATTTRSTPTSSATSSRSTSTRSRWGPTTPRRTSPSTSARTRSSRSCSTPPRRSARSPSSPTAALWRLLRDDPDRYIYPAVRHGVSTMRRVCRSGDRGGRRTMSAKRDGWNKPAAATFALPTETWREHVARRQRCLELREQAGGGEVHEINDLITYNLDIRQFAAGRRSSNCEGPELLRAFWHAIQQRHGPRPDLRLRRIPLRCPQHPRAALRGLPRPDGGVRRRLGPLRREAPARRSSTTSAKMLAQIDAHPNRRYFILKSIIVNNLYGVDIMEEAVEICKLRLFLKLVAQVETRRSDLEPLPDIDFNIRAGNTLVGFATLTTTLQEHARQGTARTSARPGRAAHRRGRRDRRSGVPRNSTRCRPSTAWTPTSSPHQTGTPPPTQQAARMNSTATWPASTASTPRKPEAFAPWRTSHQPFHWFAEYLRDHEAGRV